MAKSSILKSKGERTAPERTNHTTASVQDYLAAIYDLGGSDKPVIGARLAKHMGISAPAVTESIQRMTRGGYVKVGRGKELNLTTKGRQIAEVMARRHRLLERWLTDTLGLNWTDAHEEAHRLEHALSPRVEDRLAEMLGMPTTCPHGNPIPGMPRPTNREPFPLAQATRGGLGGRGAHHRGGRGRQEPAGVPLAPERAARPAGCASPRWRRGRAP